MHKQTDRFDIRSMTALAVAFVMLGAWLLVAWLLPVELKLERAISAVVSLVCIGILASERLPIWGETATANAARGDGVIREHSDGPNEAAR